MLPFPPPIWPAASAPGTASRGPAEQCNLAAFAARLFRHLERSDQRRWGYTYLSALLNTPGKKTVRRLARTVSDSPSVARALNQFVNGSTWDWEPVRDELTAWAGERGRPRAWSVCPVVLPKRGEASVGVHHRFDPRSGRTISCQLGLAGFGCAGVHLPAAWQLSLPTAWAADDERRRRARIPETEDYLPMWRRELAMADKLLGSSAPVPVIIDAGDGTDADATRLIWELAERRWAFAVSVPPTLPVVLTGWAARYSLPASRVRRPAIDALGLLASAAARNLRFDPESGDESEPGSGARSRAGSGAGSGAAGRERGGPAMYVTATAYLPGPSRDTDTPCRLIAARTPGGGPGRIWVTGAAESEGGQATQVANVTQAAALARLGDQTAGAVDALRDGFGLSDFEGRSFPGWHRHMTLVSAAYTFRFAGAA